RVSSATAFSEWFCALAGEVLRRSGAANDGFGFMIMKAPLFERLCLLRPALSGQPGACPLLLPGQALREPTPDQGGEFLGCRCQVQAVAPTASRRQVPDDHR